jgi:hypothetical protein
MTNKTPEQIEAEADAFVDHVTANLPDSLQTHHILRLMGTTLTSYSDDLADANRVMLELLLLVHGFYKQETGGECMCDTCVAQRKANAH